MPEQILNDLKNILLENFGIPGEEVLPESAVFNGGLDLTSMQVMVLIASIETRYKKRFERAHLVSDNFCTISRVVDSVSKKLIVW